jgi:hypothetical protein
VFGLSAIRKRQPATNLQATSALLVLLRSVGIRSIAFDSRRPCRHKSTSRRRFSHSAGPLPQSLDLALALREPSHGCRRCWCNVSDPFTEGQKSRGAVQVPGGFEILPARGVFNACQRQKFLYNDCCKDSAGGAAMLAAGRGRRHEIAGAASTRWREVA